MKVNQMTFNQRLKCLEWTVRLLFPKMDNIFIVSIIEAVFMAKEEYDYGKTEI